MRYERFFFGAFAKLKEGLLPLHSVFQSLSLDGRRLEDGPGPALESREAESTGDL